MKNPFQGSRAAPCIQTHRRADSKWTRHDKDNSHNSQFCELPKNRDSLRLLRIIHACSFTDMNQVIRADRECQ